MSIIGSLDEQTDEERFHALEHAYMAKLISLFPLKKLTLWNKQIRRRSEWTDAGIVCAECMES